MHTNEYRHPAAAELAAKLHQQNPTWSALKCATVAKRLTTAPSARSDSWASVVESEEHMRMYSEAQSHKDWMNDMATMERSSPKGWHAKYQPR